MLLKILYFESFIGEVYLQILKNLSIKNDVENEIKKLVSLTSISVRKDQNILTS